LPIIFKPWHWQTVLLDCWKLLVVDFMFKETVFTPCKLCVVLRRRDLESLNLSTSCPHAASL